MVSSIGRKWDQGKDKGYEQTLGDTPPHPHSKRLARRPDESIVDMSVNGVKGNGLKVFGVNRYEESAWEI